MPYKYLSYAFLRQVCSSPLETLGPDLSHKSEILRYWKGNIVHIPYIVGYFQGQHPEHTYIYVSAGKVRILTAVDDIETRKKPQVPLPPSQLHETFHFPALVGWLF